MSQLIHLTLIPLLFFGQSKSQQPVRNFRHEPTLNDQDTLRSETELKWNCLLKLNYLLLLAGGSETSTGRIKPTKTSIATSAALFTSFVSLSGDLSRISNSGLPTPVFNSFARIDPLVLSVVLGSSSATKASLRPDSMETDAHKTERLKMEAECLVVFRSQVSDLVSFFHFSPAENVVVKNALIDDIKSASEKKNIERRPVSIYYTSVMKTKGYITRPEFAAFQKIFHRLSILEKTKMERRSEKLLNEAMDHDIKAAILRLEHASISGKSAERFVRIKSEALKQFSILTNFKD